MVYLDILESSSYDLEQKRHAMYPIQRRYAQSNTQVNSFHQCVGIFEKVDSFGIRSLGHFCLRKPLTLQLCKLVGVTRRLRESTPHGFIMCLQV